MQGLKKKKSEATSTLMLHDTDKKPCHVPQVYKVYLTENGGIYQKQNHNKLHKHLKYLL